MILNLSPGRTNTNFCIAKISYFQKASFKNTLLGIREWTCDRTYSSHTNTSTRIYDILTNNNNNNNNNKKSTILGKEIRVNGWIRTFRDLKTQTFIEVNDGSSPENLQILLKSEEAEKLPLAVGASITAVGNLVLSPNGKSLELLEPRIEILGKCDPSYPLQKKRHSLDYLREIAHLRSRGNIIGATLRVRNAAFVGLNNYLQNQDFILVNTPILNSNDCEGAGETFLVNTKDELQLKQKKLNDSDKIDRDKNEFSKDFCESQDQHRTHAGSHGQSKDVCEAMLASESFFGIPEYYLTVSGQLEAEIFAMSHSRVYTFGPTFRAENSHTSRHLSEFWMLEPEIAFANLDNVMTIAEELIKSTVNHVREKCEMDLKFFSQRIDTNLFGRLDSDQSEPYARITYTEAVEALKKYGNDSKLSSIEWGDDFNREQEKWICETHVKKPTFVINYPKVLKPFYMRINDSEAVEINGTSLKNEIFSDSLYKRRTVACCDLLVPRIGELIGGSEREERYETLLSSIKEMNLNLENLSWYLDLRKYGTVPHAGFGLGFERFLLYVTGMENVKDVIPIPRYPKYCKF